MTSSVNGKRYIGSAVNIKARVFQGHVLELKKKIHPNSHLQNHVNKHGIKVLSFSILEFCPKEKLIEREQHYIDTLNPEFNISPTAGSQLGLIHSEYTRNKMKESHKNRSEEVNKHHSRMMIGASNPMYGKHPIPWNKGLKGVQKCSEETRQKLSKSGKGRTFKWSDEAKKKQSIRTKKRMAIKENNPMYGKKHTEESKKKMSQNKIGKMAGENHPMYGTKRSEETKKKISESLKKRYQNVGKIRIQIIFV